MQAFVERRVVGVEEAAGAIVSIAGIEGVTFTGGEPMHQAAALAELARRVRGHGLSVVCFTGFTIEQLRSGGDPEVSRLLSQVDVLIDGPYLREQSANLLWRGSSNQRVLFLSERYRAMACEVERRPASVECVVGVGGFTTTGTWPDGLVDDLERALRGW